MWLIDELEMCKKLYDTVPNTQLNDFLTPDEISTIGDKPIAFYNLRNRVLTPKGKSIYKTSTVTFQRLWDDNLKFGFWLDSIASTVMFAKHSHVEIGFSFLCWQPLTGEKVYIWAARSLAPFSFYANNKEECLDHFGEIGKMSEGELLKQVFVETDKENPFQTSGYCPLKLVCSYIYIRK